MRCSALKIYMLPTQLEKLATTHGCLDCNLNNGPYPWIVRGVSIGTVGAPLLALQCTEHVLLFNRVEASRALVVVAGAADHPHRIFGEVDSPFSASDLNHALKQSQLTLDRVALADFQAFITVAGEVGGSEGGDDARSQWMTLEGFQAFDFRIGAFVLRSDLGDVTINELMKGGAVSKQLQQSGELEDRKSVV